MPRSQPRKQAPDGRLQRSERSRERLADALYEILREGDLEPSAQKIADRAGLGIRTVFRLFSDMDALYATVNERLEIDFAPMLHRATDDDASLQRRTGALVAERIALFERIGIYMRFTSRNRDRSLFLAQNYQKLTRTLRTRLLRWLPELRDAEGPLLEALDQATSFEAWDRLRIDQRLSRPRARAAMLFATDALLHSIKGNS